MEYSPLDDSLKSIAIMPAASNFFLEKINAEYSLRNIAKYKVEVFKNVNNYI